jgi:hypothetical protein
MRKSRIREQFVSPSFDNLSVPLETFLFRIRWQSAADNRRRIVQSLNSDTSSSAHHTGLVVLWMTA